MADAWLCDYVRCRYEAQVLVCAGLGCTLPLVRSMGEVHPAHPAHCSLAPAITITRICQFLVGFCINIFAHFSHVFFAYFLLINEGSPLAPVAAARLELAEYNVHQNISGHFCRPGAPCCRLYPPPMVQWKCLTCHKTHLYLRLLTPHHGLAAGVAGAGLAE